MMIRYFISIVFIMAVAPAAGQEVISSGGETQDVSGVSVSWTLGEGITATGSTGERGLTQGFHQPRLWVTPVGALQMPGIDITVYPNPTHDFVNIQMSRLPENSSMVLFDLSGKKLLERELHSRQSHLSLKDHPGGSYLLKLFGNRNKPLKTFKVVKK